MKPRVLLIGYGNPSRRDDGVGWYVAHRVQARFGERIDVETRQQLEIDLAEHLGDYYCVFFVDAHVGEGADRWHVERVEPVYHIGATSHHFTPAALLALAEVLYDRLPEEAWLYTIRAFDLNFGETLSPVTRQSADQVAEAICQRTLDLTV